ncbi:hypothetical protein SAMN04488112_11832 [Melghirimyces thermohalophilus]|uniref:Uncharacterized protein n=1 Tax=Melghirimyces thermohalophilus TaxID=1236220 RepID=A0A1G6PVG2_9BACL|nr:hypothetical protein SAMN04488112_11832 [Melghirimyces thermohalophilus]
MRVLGGLLLLWIPLSYFLGKNVFHSGWFTWLSGFVLALSAVIAVGFDQKTENPEQISRLMAVFYISGF